jgi:hypothetical protein
LKNRPGIQPGLYLRPLRRENETLSHHSNFGVLLREKIQTLETFVSVSEDLYQSLAAGDVAKAARLTEERGSLIGSIDEVDKKMAGDQPELSPIRETPPSPANHPFGSLREALQGLLQEAAAWDRKCLERAQGLRDETREELLTLRQGHRAARRYTQPKEKEVHPRFMDVKH